MFIASVPDQKQSHPNHHSLCKFLPSISSTFYARLFHTNFWRQSQNVIWKAAKKGVCMKKAREKTLMKLTPAIQQRWSKVREMWKLFDQRFQWIFNLDATPKHDIKILKFPLKFLIHISLKFFLARNFVI